MTTTYTGSNIGLEYDAATGTWGYKNIAQDFIDPNTFSSTDPSFEYVPVKEDDEDEQDNSTVCPPGYIYDETLKQCVPDPNYQNPFVQQGGGKDDNRPDNSVYIPSNETKENWIKNANVIIPAGQEGAGKTGYQNFIDNLKDRGWIKNEDGKMIFKKDNIGSIIAQAGLNRIGMTGEVEAKTNKIIKDLQRMGGINAQIDMDEDGNIDFSSELELADSPNTFATYNYDGTDLFGGNYTGFTTPATNPLGVQKFATWEDYMAAILKPFTSTSTEIKKTQVSAGDRLDAEIRKKEADALAAEIKAEKEAVDLAIKKRKQEEQKAISENQYNQQDFSKRDSSEESGGSYGRDEDRPVIKSKPKTEYSGRPIGNPMGAQTNKPSKPKSKPKPPSGPDLRNR